MAGEEGLIVAFLGLVFMQALTQVKMYAAQNHAASFVT